MATSVAERLAADLPSGVTILVEPAPPGPRRPRCAIAAAAGRPVSILPELAEVDFGRVDGLTWEQVARLEPDLAGRIVAGDPVDWPGGETAASVADRATRVATTVRGLDGPVVVVSHGRFLAALTSSSPPGPTTPLSLIPLAPGSVIRVRFAGREGNG